jgi:repressor LexA
MKTRVSKRKTGETKLAAVTEMSKPMLTPKQKAMLDFILQYRESNGYAPSQHEIARHFGFSSLGTVQNYLVRLERQGAIQKDWNSRRGTQVLIRPSEKGPSTPFSKGRKVFEETSSELSLPLLGRVAAGRPIEALEHGEFVEVPRSMISAVGDHFVLKVQGDSMIEEGILDGDQVIIKKQRTAQNGQTVVALIGSEATIKIYFHRRGRVELHPANPKYTPIVVDADVKEDFRIEGIMVGLIRKR